MTLEQKIERQLYNLLCEGGGNGETISKYASRIARVAKKHLESQT
jgi:hypothetical protein